METQFKGTIGPWHHRDLSIFNEENKNIALTAMLNGNYDAESLNNARLISSAPDLLEALQKVNTLAKRLGILEDLNAEEFNYMEEAIKKALGEQ